MSAIFLFVEHRLVYSTLFADEISHRVEFISSRHDFLKTLQLSFKNFTLGHTHVMAVHTVIILPILFLATVLIFYKKEWKQEKLFLFLFLLNYLLSFWYALWFNVMWTPLKEKVNFLNTFNLARFSFFVR